MIAVAPVFEPQEFTLSNGLRLVIVPTGAAPVATLMVLYKVGARDEAVGYTGSSHLLEHMLFKGTPTYSRATGRAYADVMKEIGAALNATTWIDRTNYFETVPKEYLPLAVEMEADRMRGALIADSERKSEMTVVRNELERGDNDAARVLGHALVATAFREHPYHHPTIGWRADVEGVSTARLRELYDTFYHPGNAVVFVVGDVEIGATRELIERRFGALAANAAPLPEVHTTEPPQHGERTFSLKRPGDDTLLSYAYHTPSAFGERRVLTNAEIAERASRPLGPSEGDALDLFGRVLARGKTSRLARALVDERLALDVSAQDWGSRDPGLFQVTVAIRPGVAMDRVREVLDRELAMLADEGPTADELARAKTALALGRAFARDSTFGIAQRLAEFEAVGTWRFEEGYTQRLESVSIDDVTAAAQAYLHEDNRSIGTLVPGTPRAFAQIPFARIDERVTPAWIEAAPLARPAAVTGTPFAERIERATFGGVRARYVANEGTSTVHVRGLLDAGIAMSPDRPMLPTVLAEMLARGTRVHDRRTLEERLDRHGIRRAYGADDDRSSGYDPLAFRFSAACAAEHLGELLEVLAEELREPSFDPLELDRVRAELVGALRLARTNTGWRAMQRFLSLAYTPGDINAEPDVDALIADVESIDVAALAAYHANVLLRAPLRVAGAGGVTADEFLARIGRTLGALPLQAAALDTPRTAPLAARARRESVAVEDKPNVDVVLGRASDLHRASPDFEAAAIANGILGQSTLSSRLGMRLRDRDGLTYGITSGFLAPGRTSGPWRISVGVNAANVERAIDAVHDVLDDYAADGPTAREFDAQRNSMVGAQRVSLATSAGLATMLERLETYGLPDGFVDGYRATLDAVTLADANAAIARYLSPNDLIVVDAGGS